jgi:membrane-bound serine protease (ClpP class)
MITMAADVAAMAPGTNIGAAHPVGLGGQEIGESMADKVTNDMAAYSSSIAAKRGRNAEWVEKAVRESVSITASEALQKNVIDLVAEDLDDLLRQLEGREVPGKGRLSLGGARVTIVQETLRTKVLRTISNPNIAYILLMIGMAGLFFELSHPGAIFPGVVGGIAIILAFFAFQTLPVNATGILLIILAVIFFVLELFITSYGLLSIAGIGSLLLGSLMLFEGNKFGVRLSWAVLLPTVALVSGFFIAIVGLVLKTHLSKPRTGAVGLVGEIGVVKVALQPQGKVFIHGELWHARARTTVAVGVHVRVVAVEGLVLEVEPEGV